MLLPIMLALPFAALASTSTSGAPPVFIDKAVITGINTGSLSKYLGIPFADAPRFRLPVPIPFYKGHIEATHYGPICPQQQVTPSSLSESPTTSSDNNPGESEDCLSINVIRPKDTSAEDDLPVLVWIYGGGFEVGSTFLYDDVSTRIVTRSIEMGQPVVHVAMNYRVSALGFLASKEVQEEGIGNFGLYDQRVALRWVHKYIHAFGGDPDKVTIWGQSAGAVSVSLQMLSFGGQTEGLFRGAFMQSGAPPPVGEFSTGQKYYNALVIDAGCEHAEDTLECLRGVPYDTIIAAINKSPDFHSYSSVKLAWEPRVDGVFLQDRPNRLIADGKVANIPAVSGNVDDEATLFSVSQSNVTTDADFRNYVETIYFPDASAAELAPFWEYYPPVQAKGSPYDTGDANVLYEQYKRIASFQGDLFFQGPRRFFLQNIAVPGRHKVWSYLSKRFKWTSVYGSYHSSDIESGILDDYVIRFTYALDPNLENGTYWPPYCATGEGRQLLTLAEEASVAPYILEDTYRERPIEYLHDLADKYPL